MIEKKHKQKKSRKLNYNMWGYLFIAPFFIVFILFQLIPLCQTIYFSLFEYYFKLGLTQVGPNFIGFTNYITLFKTPFFWKLLGNTIILWIMGVIPQFAVALLLAVWFTDARLKLKLQRLFKTVVYMPNLVMAAAFGMLFLMLFNQNGPVNQILLSLGWISEPYIFMESKVWVRIIIAFINFLMWTGNTTILLMSGIMGIDESIFESARLDGAGSFKIFKDITMPLLMPIFVYVFITSMIGGIQLFDSAQIFTQGSGGPDATSYTLMMYLFNFIMGGSANYGMAGALSVILFIITGVLSIFVFRSLTPTYNALKAEKKNYGRRMRWLRRNNKDYEEAMNYERNYCYK